jgi:peptidoglycan/LPS O-acetylase OafA/YrhL
MKHPLPPGGRNRLVELDALRGLAALCVLLYHGWYSQPVQPLALGWLFQHTPLHVVTSGRQPVVFFFVLSGFVLTRAMLASPPPSWANYAAQRTVRLGLPVAGALVASVLLYALAWRGPLPDWSGGHYMVEAMWTEPPNLPGLLRQALLLGHDGEISLDPVLWSLVHEWRVSMLLPAVLLFRRRPLGLLGVGLAAWLVAGALGAHGTAVGLGATLPETLLATLYFLLPFCVGGALALAPAPPLARWVRVMLGLAVLALACTNDDVAGILASALLIVLARQPGPLLAWLRWRGPVWLGKVSFSLYLIHLPLLAAMVHLLEGIASQSLAVGLGMLASLPAAALLHRAVEQPAHRLAKRMAGWGHRRLAASAAG